MRIIKKEPISVRVGPSTKGKIKGLCRGNESMNAFIEVAIKREIARRSKTESVENDPIEKLETRVAAVNKKAAEIFDILCVVNDQEVIEQIAQRSNNYFMYKKFFPELVEKRMKEKG